MFMVCSWITWPGALFSLGRSRRRKSVGFFDVSYVSWRRLFRWKCKSNESSWILCTETNDEMNTKNNLIETLHIMLPTLTDESDELMNYLLNEMGNQNNASSVLNVVTEPKETELLLGNKEGHMVPSDRDIIPEECVLINEMDSSQQLEDTINENFNILVRSNLQGDARMFVAQQLLIDGSEPSSILKISECLKNQNIPLQNWKIHAEETYLVFSKPYDKIVSYSLNNPDVTYSTFTENARRRKENHSDRRMMQTMEPDVANHFSVEVYPSHKCENLSATSWTQKQCIGGQATDTVRIPISDNQEFFDNYSMSNIIGRGAFSSVRSAVHIQDDKKVVVKVIRKDRLPKDNLLLVPYEELTKYHNSNERKYYSDIHVDLPERYQKFKNGSRDIESGECIADAVARKTSCLIPREIWLLSQLSHPHIVQILDWADDRNGFYFLVMPSHGLGMDLFEFIDRQPSLDEPLGSYMFRQLASAVSYLHSVHLAHRDIKDENVLVDEQFRLKLIDFGSAIPVTRGSKVSDVCGTTEYCSPEVLIEKQYDPFFADIWAVGVTLYTLMFGENPFTTREEIVNCRLHLPHWISDGLRQVFDSTLQVMPTRRLNAKELQELPWVNQTVNLENYSFNSVLGDTSFQGNISADYRTYTPESTLLKIE